MYKLTTIIALLSTTSTSAFVVNNRPATPTQNTTQLSATNFDKISNAATVAAASLTTAAIATPLAALAEQDDDYVYGAVAAPGGLGLAAGLGVLEILTAAVPAVLAPGEDAFNEMKERDESKWGK